MQTTPLTFTAKNSGTPLAPVQYIGYPEKRYVFISLLLLLLILHYVLIRFSQARILGGPEIKGWTAVDKDVALEYGLASQVIQVPFFFLFLFFSFFLLFSNIS